MIDLSKRQVHLDGYLRLNSFVLISNGGRCSLTHGTVLPLYPLCVDAPSMPSFPRMLLAPGDVELTSETNGLLYLGHPVLHGQKCT